MKPQNGYILYQGPSELDGEPIVCIATGFAKASQNTKTGAEIQTWILRADLNPYAATQTGADASICGACKHRGTVEPITQNPTQGSARREAPSGEGNPTRNVGRTCYVRITMGGPAAVWRAYRNGAYLEAPWNTIREALRGRMLRLGSYGDPAAVPAEIWRDLAAVAAGHTGYTHQWRTRSDLRTLCMASVDSVAEYHEAKAAGWRTFRVRARSATPLANEVTCPASAEAGHKTTCSACKACGGTSARARADIVIAAHGAGATRLNVAA
jgi:hypothetical protein